MPKTDSTADNAAIQEEVKKNTTNNLFPEYAVPEDTKEVTPEPIEEKEVVKEETPETKTEDVPEYLSAEDFGDRLVKIKVDGVEQTIPFKDAIRRIQTDKYLTEKGQKLSEERKALEELKKSIISDNQAPINKEPEPDDEIYREYVKPHISKYEEEIKTLRETVKEMKSTLQPIQYQNNLKQIDLMLKEEGYDDFMKYVPQIEEKIYSLPVEQQPNFDSAYGFTTIYKDLKIKELREMSKKPPEQIKADTRPKPKVVNIEGGGNTPSGADDYASKYQTAFKRAQETGDFTEVLRIKGVI